MKTEINQEKLIRFKFRHSIQMTIMLALVYLFITGNLELSNILVGIVVGFLISTLIRPQQLAVEWRNLPVAIWSTIRYIGHLIWDLFASSIQVAKIVLNPELPIDPGIIEIDAGCQSELSAALSAHALTLTPGELVVEMDDEGRLFAHSLDQNKTSEVTKEVQELRRDLLSKIFG